MRVLNAYLSDNSDSLHHCRMTHVLLTADPLVVPSNFDIIIDRMCEIAHSEDIDYMDCPVASRWTLLRAGT